MKNYHYYIDKISSLRQGQSAYGFAPHKPILVLSLIDYLEKSVNPQNRFLMDDVLFSLFSQNWKILVTTKHSANVSYPIRYLTSDGLGWQLIQNGNPVSGIDRSKKKLVAGRYEGRFDDGFFEFLLSSENRILAKMAILDAYFPDNKTYPLPYYVREIEDMVLAEPQAIYTKTTRDIEGFIRDWKFKKVVMKQYRDTCAISGMNVKPSKGIIEACHIVPHSVSGMDIISNGVALCVNLHRAFDRGMISFNKQYEVLVKPESFFVENDSPYNIRQFEGNRLLLPENELYWPKQNYMKEHREIHRF